MNLAQRRWMKKQMEAGNYNALKGYRNTEAQTLAASVKALSGWTGGVFTILSAYNATDTVLVRRRPDGYDSTARAATNSYYTASATNQWYIVEGATLRLDGGTATSSIRLEYIKEPVTLVQGGASEVILIPSNYYDELLDLAVKAGQEEEARLPTLQLAQIKEAIVDKEIANSRELANK